MTTNFFSPLSFVAVFGSGIQDLGSGIWDPGWIKIRIRDPGLTSRIHNFGWLVYFEKLECSKQALTLEYLLLGIIE